MSTLSKPLSSWAWENSAMYSGSTPAGISSAGLMPPPNRLTVTPRDESRSRLTPIMPMTSMLDMPIPLELRSWRTHPHPNPTPRGGGNLLNLSAGRGNFLEPGQQYRGVNMAQPCHYGDYQSITGQGGIVSHGQDGHP